MLLVNNTTVYKLPDLLFDPFLYHKVLIIFMYFRMCPDPENPGKRSFFCWTSIITHIKKYR